MSKFVRMLRANFETAWQEHLSAPAFNTPEWWAKLRREAEERRARCMDRALNAVVISPMEADEGEG